MTEPVNRVRDEQRAASGPPLFSVVLCTYNRAHIVTNAIEAVLAQSFDSFELIVVNDGSADSTHQVLSSYEAHPKVQVVNRPNGGLSAARNSGIGIAEGRFVIFLDDDDLVAPEWLARLAATIGTRTGLVNCTCTWVDEHGENPYVYPLQQHAIFSDVEGAFVAGTFAVDRDVLTEIGGYADDIRVSHQAELLMRILPVIRARHMTSDVVDEPLITIERRSPDDRPLSQPRELLEGAEYMIEHHGSIMRLRPSSLANHHAIAGVNAAKLREYGRARRHLCLAVGAEPKEFRHVVRLATAIIPWIAARRWPPVT